MNHPVIAPFSAFILASGIVWAGSAIPEVPQYNYLYEDIRLGAIGEAVGDLVAVPQDFDADEDGEAVILLRIRIPAVKEGEVSATGYLGETGRIPGPFRYAVAAVSRAGEVTDLIDAGPGRIAEDHPFNGLACGNRGVYLFNKTTEGGKEGFPRLRYYPGTKRAQEYNSDMPAGKNGPAKLARYAMGAAKILESRKLAVAPVEVIIPPKPLVRVRGVPGWGGEMREVAIGPDREGGQYIGGLCVGIDAASSLYLLMTRPGGGEEFAVRRPQDLVIISREGERVATVELAPWRDDLWSSNGENIRVRRDGTILELWSQGSQVSLRRWPGLRKSAPLRIPAILALSLGIASIGHAMAAPATVYAPASAAPSTAYGTQRKVFMLGNMPGSIVAVYTTSANELHWGYSNDSGLTWTDGVISAGPAHTFTAVLDPATNNLHVLYSTGPLGGVSALKYVIGAYSSLPADPSYAWSAPGAVATPGSYFQFPSAVLASAGGVTYLHVVYGEKETSGSAISNVRWNYKVLDTSTSGWIFPDPGRDITVWTLLNNCQGACPACPNNVAWNPGAIPSLVAAGNGALFMTAWVSIDKPVGKFFVRRMPVSGTGWDAGTSVPFATFDQGAPPSGPCLSLSVPPGAVHAAMVSPSGNEFALVIPAGNTQNPLSYQLLFNNTTATSWNGPGSSPSLGGVLAVANAGDGYPAITATPLGTYFIMMADSGVRSNGNIVYYIYNGALSGKTTLWDDAANIGNKYPSVGLDASQDLMVAWSADSGASAKVRYYSLVLNPLRGFVQVTSTGICEHETITVSFSVSNTGTLPVTAPSADIWFNPAGGDATTWQVISSPAMPAQIDPGDTAVLVWTVSATGLSPLVLGLGSASFTATVSGTYMGGPVATIKNSPVVTVFGPPKLGAAMDLSSTTLSTGQMVTVHLTVTDEGGSAMSGIAPVIGWNQDAGGPTVLAPVSGPVPATVNLVPGGGATFVWVYQVVSAGTPSSDKISFSATAAGTDTGCGLAAAASALSGHARIERGAVLDGSVVEAYPATICSGDTITVVQTVTNTGVAGAVGVSPSLALTVDGPGTVVSGSSPSAVGWLAAGMSTTFTWTYNASGPGQVRFTATTTANDSNSLFPISTGPAASGTVNILGVGIISLAVSAPAYASIGQWFTVVMKASNPGNLALSAFTPELALGPGGALVVPEGVPPVGGGSIPAGGSVQVSWTFSANGSGLVAFTATATAISCGGALVEASKTVSTTIQIPASLIDSVAASPGTICRGVPFPVTVTVVNTGEAACNGVMVSTPLVTGTGLASIVAAPSQAVPAVIKGGANKIYTWTYVAYQGGTLRFTVTASGFDANSGLAVAKAVAVSVPVQAWNGGMLTGSGSAPLTISEGRPFEVVLTVTNTGDMSLASLHATAFPRSDSAPATLISGPSPAGPVVLPAGTMGLFAWTWKGMAEGNIILTLTASGFDGACGSPYVRFPITIAVAGPHLVLEKTAPAHSSSADPVTFVLAVRNTGGDTAYSVLLVDTLPAPLIFVSASGAYTRLGAVVGWDAGDIPPGGVKTFRISGRVKDRETDLTVSNTAWASYRNWGGVLKPPVRGTASVVLEPLLVKRVFPNPFNPAKAVRGTLKFSGIPTGSSVRIYTTRGLLVWDGGASGGRHTVEWDGKNQAGKRAVPGVYLCVLEGGGDKTVFRLIVE